MNYTIYQVDAFTTEVFKGNPAGVMILKKELPEDLMQNIAAEMNLSETAFVNISAHPFQIRYFTPTIEIPLCGHATLASAHILFQKKIVQNTQSIQFKTIETLLKVSSTKEGIKMIFPKFEIQSTSVSKRFFKIMGFEPTETYKFKNDWIIALTDNEQDIAKASPLFNEMEKNGLGHLIITSLSTESSIDYVLRCFAPKSGINEDPVTGSIQCGLASLWNLKTGKNTFKAKQLSARTGIMDIHLTDSTVEITGNAVTVFEVMIKI